MQSGEGGAAPVTISVLGPLRVDVRGAEVVISAARERAVLARLAIDAGRCVGDHELIEAVWGDAPPASARGTLQTYVSHLRRLVGPDTIARDPNGYRLCGAAVDTHAFTEAMSQARTAADPAERVRLLRTALDAWRGAPLDELDGDAALAVRVSLEEDRVHAAELLLEARLELEPPGAVVPALEELCVRHPRREHAAALLMTALYRAGRQADALGAYRRLRDVLVDELGLDPGPALRELEQRILRQDPTLLDPAVPAVGSGPPGLDPTAGSHGARASATPAMPLPARLTTGRSTAPFVGRRPELHRVLAALDATEGDGAVRTVLLRGDAGIGKTRLAREVALTAAGRGWLVTWGRCPADSTGAFHAIAEALDPLVQWQPSLAQGHEHLLASVLPALAGRTADPLAILRAGAEQRFALLEALTAVAERAGRVAPLLVVVDDVHWADAGTAAFLEHLAARHAARVVVAATARSPEPTEVPHVAPLIERLQRDHELHTVALGGLSEIEVRALLDRAATEPASHAVVAALHAKTGGNPFFLGEVLAAFGPDGLAAHDGPLPLTAGVQSVLAQRLDHLTADELDVLAAAAAFGADFVVAGCAACADVPERDAMRTLDRAVGMAIVEEGASPGEFSFVHGLLQTAVWERTARARRAQLVERAAAWTAAQTIAEPGALGRRVANRVLAEAAPPAPAAPAALDERDPLLAASRASLLRIAAGVTPLLSTPGVEVVVASDLTDERAGRTVLRWARSMHLRGDTTRALGRALECGELARQLPAPALLVEAALVAAQCADLLPGRPRHAPHPEVSRLLADAVSASSTLAGGSDADRAQLLVHRAVAGDDAADRLVLARAAEAAARRAGSVRWQAEARLAQRAASWPTASVADRVAITERILAELADAAEDPDLAGRARAAFARDLIAAGRVGDARAQLDRLVAATDLPTYLLGAARLQQAALALAAGDATSAAETIEWAAAGGHVRSPDDPYDPLATLLLVLAVEQDQLADARPSLREAVDRWPADLLWIGALTAAEADAGDVAPACARLDETARRAERGPTAAGDVGGLVLLGRAARRLGHPLSDRIARRLAAHRDELALAGDVGVLGPVGDVLGAR